MSEKPGTCKFCGSKRTDLDYVELDGGAMYDVISCLDCEMNCFLYDVRDEKELISAYNSNPQDYYQFPSPKEK